MMIEWSSRALNKFPGCPDGVRGWQGTHLALAADVVLVGERKVTH